MNGPLEAVAAVRDEDEDRVLAGPVDAEPQEEARVRRGVCRVLRVRVDDESLLARPSAVDGDGDGGGACASQEGERHELPEHVTHACSLRIGLPPSLQQPAQ